MMLEVDGTRRRDNLLGFSDILLLKKLLFYLLFSYDMIVLI